MKDALQKAWLSRGWLAILLWPISQVYALAVATRRFLYEKQLLSGGHAGVPTIVVGNVIVGGGGKTPLVIELVRHLSDKGIKVGVISRGTGRRSDTCIEVTPDSPVSDSGDEPALIRHATAAPVFVARKRLDAARALLSRYPATQVLICDDGLQHYALERDLEIAVFDDRGVGNGWLLPAGPLREVWPARLHKGIDLVLHTGIAPAFGGFRSSRRLADLAVAADGTTMPLSDLVDHGVTAVAGIARPESFFGMLRARGLTLARTIGAPDHFNPDEVTFDIPSGSTLLCTQKDAVKLFGHRSLASCRVLAVPLVFRPEAAFLDAFDAHVATLLSALPSRNGHKTP